MRAAGALAVFILFAALTVLPAQSIGAQNYTPQQANATFANATAYIAQVNQSSYLFFSPNLTQAYEYLNISQRLSNTSPSLSVAYAQRAAGSAHDAYSQIGVYRSYALLFIALFTIIAGIALYMFMRPIKTARRRGKRQ